MVSRSLNEDAKSKNPRAPLPLPYAGYKEIGETRPALAIAQGAFAAGAFASRTKKEEYNLESALTENA